jgi:alpha-1,2-mannosyltransferase
LGLLEIGPVFVVAVVLAPFVIEGGSLSPWNPNFCDLLVYRLAVDDLWAGRDIYDTVSPVYGLKFIYPPAAALVMAPLRFGTELVWELVWTWLNAWAMVVVLRRCRVPRGAVLSILAVIAVMAFEPIRTTIGYGQVNLLLMALVVVDLLPGDRPRRLPRGLLIGLAAAIKLTPLLFVVLLVLIGARRAAAWATGAFAGLSLLAAAILPSETIRFVSQFGHGDFSTGASWLASNQSWTGWLTRLGSDSGPWLLAGLLVGLAVAGLATVVAALWWRQGERLCAVGLVGLATCLASPLSWSHHHVWGLLALVGAATAPRLARWVKAGLIAWGLWLALCPTLSLLPPPGGEPYYNGVEQVIVNLVPAGGSALILACAITAWRDGRLSRPWRSWLSPEPSAFPPPAPSAFPPPMSSAFPPPAPAAFSESASPVAQPPLPTALVEPPPGAAEPLSSAADTSAPAAVRPQPHSRPADRPPSRGGGHRL